MQLTYAQQSNSALKNDDDTNDDGLISALVTIEHRLTSVQIQL